MSFPHLLCKKLKFTEKTGEIKPNFTQKPLFTDTGSAKITVSEQNQAENAPHLAENTENVNEIMEISVNSANFLESEAENSTKPAKSPDKTAKSSEKDIKSRKERANDAQSDRISAQNKNYLSFKDSLFTEESIQGFKTEFPLVDIDTLKSSQGFQALLSLLSESPTLSSVYKQLNLITASIEENVSKRLAQQLANSSSSVGSLASSAPASAGFFTKEQVKQMTQKQIKENYEKIRASQAKW